MRSAAVSAVCCVLLNSGLAQVSSTPSLQPSPLEAFVGRPTAEVTWSKVIGRLESQEARATITALIVEDKTTAPSVMRGIRVNLTHIGATPSCDWKYWAWRIMCQRANAAVYVEEGPLETVRNSIKRGAAELRPMEFISQYSTTTPGRASTGLIVCGYQFSDRRPEDLAELFTSAITELKAAPR
jgi:hypothetical protein